MVVFERLYSKYASADSLRVRKSQLRRDRERRSLVGGPRAPMMDTKLHREGPIRAREAQYVGVRLLALEVDGRADRRVLVRGDLVRMLVVVDEEAQRRVC